jgi:hypothetical protein
MIPSKAYSHGYNERLRDALQSERADPDVLRVMMRSGGGGFVSNLASAWLHADATNNRLLFAHFGHYYREYERTLRDEQRRRDQKGRDTP